MRLPFLDPSRPEAVHECRSCGTTVAHADDSCPYCPLSDIVRYELD